MAEKGSDYVAVNLPKWLIDTLDRLIKKSKRLGNRSFLIKRIISEWLDKYEVFEEEVPYGEHMKAYITAKKALKGKIPYEHKIRIEEELKKEIRKRKKN